MDNDISWFSDRLKCRHAFDRKNEVRYLFEDKVSLRNKCTKCGKEFAITVGRKHNDI